MQLNKVWSLLSLRIGLRRAAWSDIRAHGEASLLCSVSVHPIISGQLQMRSKRGNPVCPLERCVRGIVATICVCLFAHSEPTCLPAVKPSLLFASCCFVCDCLLVGRRADSFNLGIHTLFSHFGCLTC